MSLIFTLSLLFSHLQMYHPIQMKPADSENRNGKLEILYFICKS